MRNSTRATAALLGALVLTGVTAVSAGAAGTDDTITTVAVAGGSLDITVPSDLAFTGTAPGQTATGQLTGITVADSRAGTAGWEASVNVAEFTSVTVAATIPAANLSYTATPTTATTGSSTVVAAPAVTGGPTASVVQTATAVVGNNAAVWNANVALTIPAQALAATDYTAALTHSVL